MLNKKIIAYFILIFIVSNIGAYFYYRKQRVTFLNTFTYDISAKLSAAGYQVVNLTSANYEEKSTFSLIYNSKEFTAIEIIKMLDQKFFKNSFDEDTYNTFINGFRVYIYLKNPKIKDDKYVSQMECKIEFDEIGSKVFSFSSGLWMLFGVYTSTKFIIWLNERKYN